MRDAKVYKMLTDPAGGAYTYGAAVDVPGMKACVVTKVYESKILRGDNVLLSKHGILMDITIKIGYAKLSFDVEAVLTGATVADSGSAPNQKVTLSVLPGDVIPYWKLEAACVSVDTPGGDIHLVAYKCVVTGNLDTGFAEEDYQLQGFEASAVPTIGTPLKWLDEVANETAVAIV
jgi:hypothetical protein